MKDDISVPSEIIVEPLHKKITAQFDRINYNVYTKIYDGNGRNITCTPPRSYFALDYLSKISTLNLGRKMGFSTSAKAKPIEKNMAFIDVKFRLDSADLLNDKGYWAPNLNVTVRVPYVVTDPLNNE